MIVDPPRVVFDCNVGLQAMLGVGPAFRCFEFVDTGRVVLLSSPATFTGLRDVLTRPKLLKKYPQLTHERASAFLNLFVKRATLIDMVPHAVDFPRDRKDEPYLDLAVAQHASYIVTRDQNHLLNFAVESTPEANEFRRIYPWLLIVDPVAFIAAIARQPTT